jgi:hypothetical protein
MANSIATIPALTPISLVSLLSGGQFVSDGLKNLIQVYQIDTNSEERPDIYVFPTNGDIVDANYISTIISLFPDLAGREMEYSGSITVIVIDVAQDATLKWNVGTTQITATVKAGRNTIENIDNAYSSFTDPNTFMIRTNCQVFLGGYLVFLPK